MADIFLDLRRIDYRTDHNVPLTAWRGYADALFLTPSGGTVPFSCIVDSGAPFSVLPYSLWHDRNLSWTSLGRRLIRQGGQVSDPLKWQGEDCSLGQTSVSLIDRRTSQQTGPFFLVAKFVDRPLPDARQEMISVLGMNFLTDNDLRLVLDGAGGNLVGYVSGP
jgi:hypothetical protein